MKFPNFVNQEESAWRWWSLAVLLLAAAFRLVMLQNVPPGLAQDEVLNADIVTFIREGRHALFFREGYGHEPLYHYWSVPFQVLFGDNFLSIRLPAVYLGMLLVALTMRWARREFGGVTAVTAGIGLAVSWWPIIFSRIGLRPILEPLLLVVTAWFWQRRPWLAGLFLGLSVYSYTGARVLFLIPFLWALTQLIAAPGKTEKRRQLGTAAIILVASLLVFLPLFWILQADPSLQQRVDQLAGPLTALREGDLDPIWQSIVSTLGVFSFAGDPRWTYSLPGRPLFDPVTSIFFYFGFLLTLFRWRQPRYALVLVWLLVGLLPSAITPQSPSTVRLIGAMPVIYLLPGTAVSACLSWIRRGDRDLRKYFLPGMGIILIIVFISNGYRTIQDGFVRWPNALETRLKYQTVLLDEARYWSEEPTSRWVVADGFYEPIDADSLRRNLGRNFVARWVQTGSEVAGAIVLPDESGPGRFYVPEYAAVDNGLLSAAGVAERPLYRSPSKPSFAVYDLPEQPTIPEKIEPVLWDNLLSLLGYEIMPVMKGGPLRLFSYWRVEGPLPDDLAIFVHLLGEDDAIISQHDGFDVAAVTVRPGDIIIQSHNLPIPTALPVAKYSLQLGLYTRGNGRRLEDINDQETNTLWQGSSLPEFE